MQMSEHGLGLLEKWEGFELNLYKDSAGLPTIGVIFSRSLSCHPADCDQWRARAVFWWFDEPTGP